MVSDWQVANVLSKSIGSRPCLIFEEGSSDGKSRLPNYYPTYTSYIINQLSKSLYSYHFYPRSREDDLTIDFMVF